MAQAAWQAIWDAAKALDSDLCGVSWNGFNLAGDKRSIDEVHRLMHLEERANALQREILSEREAVAKYAAALRDKDEAMGVLFARLRKAGVDCSDLIS